MNNNTKKSSRWISAPYTFYRSGIPKFNDLKCEYVVWAPFFWHPRFLINDQFQKTLAVYHRLKERGRSVTLMTKRSIGQVFGKKVIYFFFDWFDGFKFSDYTSIFSHISHNLELQDNLVFPSEYEARFWENKVLMHRMFAECDIRTPKSIIINVREKISPTWLSDLKLPFLVKEDHSCSSQGLHLIDKLDHFNALISDDKFKKRNRYIVIQQLLNIRRDIRVILVGKEIIWHYWRINPSEEWKPTATSYGSCLDFGSFPERWRSWMIDTFSRLSLKTGALDIAWQNDDLSTEPYVLEVSPVYQPNPEPKKEENLRIYGRWKKGLSLVDNYHQAFIDLEFLIQSCLVDELIRSWESN